MRQARWVLLACIVIAPVLTASCVESGLLYEPAPGRAGILIAYTSTPTASASRAVPDRARIIVSRSTGIIYDRTHDLPADSSEVRVRVDVELQQDSEPLTVVIELLEGTRVLSRGGQTIIAKKGETTVASILADRLDDNLTAGHGFMCYLSAEGEANCFGFNDAGQLGFGSNTGSSRPVPVSTNQRFVAIDAGGSFVCALTETGVAYCWGQNQAGQLGNGSQNSSSTPVAVSGNLRFTQLSAGYLYACGLTATQELYCWGTNQDGQLAIQGSTALTPTAAGGGRRFSYIHAGFSSTCGVSAGELYCWGFEYGHGIAQRNVPTLVAGGNNFERVVSGPTHSCTLNSAGAAHCWGATVYRYGQLGNNSLTGSLTPVAVSGGITFSAISVASANNIYAGHTCGIDVTGHAFCWGINYNYELGVVGGPICANAQIGPIPCMSTPSPVSGGHRFTTIVAGNQTSCGIVLSGELYCWGAGTFWLTGSASATPIAVGPPVTPPVPTTITLTLPRLTLAVGDSVIASATLNDQRGYAIPTSVAWTSSDTTRLTISYPVVTQTTMRAILHARARGGVVVTVTGPPGISTTANIVVN
jgi:alpha-tubulin suppressor-like RCC1 family protein